MVSFHGSFIDEVKEFVAVGVVVVGGVIGDGWNLPLGLLSLALLWCQWKMRRRRTTEQRGDDGGWRVDGAPETGVRMTIGDGSEGLG